MAYLLARGLALDLGLTPLALATSDDLHQAPMKNELRFRQVHLDFHTSEHIPGVGCDFDAGRFVATLQAAHVDSVTLFSRCHHGWIYHDTRFPNRHPHLTCDLLAEQIRACHGADIRCPIYITVGWDEYAARLHPEWVEIDATGRRFGRGPLQKTGGWLKLDFASPYIDYVIEQTLEVLDRFGDEVDGFFFDIIHQWGVHSPWCMDMFVRRGMNPEDASDQDRLRDELKLLAVTKLSEAVWTRRPDVSIFHNGGHVGPVLRQMLKASSHIEVESLPTGGWGYGHFPMTGRYARTLGKDFLGMTGKFSETWGHFNSYKPVAALEFECFSALSIGGKCSIGDQLHPSGVLDPATYDAIGAVYSQVEVKEPWCKGARGLAEVAVLNAEEHDRSSERMDPRNLGATRMLLEGGYQFDIIDSQADLSGYRVLILPDVIVVDEALQVRIEEFLNSGGALVASGRSGFGLKGFPSESTATDQPFSPDFLRTGLLGNPSTDYVMYERGVDVVPAEGSEILGTLTYPYFERSYDRFVSHAHTPPHEVTDKPAILRKGSIVHFVHPIFTTYALHSMTFHRDIVLETLRLLLPDRLLETTGPTSLQATMTELPDGTRVVHLLHYVPERRGLHIDVVEDRLPVHQVEVKVAGLWRAELVPQQTALATEHGMDQTVFVVPVVDGHQMVHLT